eukprot:TRINITY_DN18896_c0_g1_i1.p1 TRINITY_DN18896_c0_g1~~TRINITY_DN18896_c0_g1_i1.p1  ORF type:complete len:201 (-),score=7.02 TRINITY_DN18896_c0_g1_i1:99-656(-)
MLTMRPTTPRGASAVDTPRAQQVPSALRSAARQTFAGTPRSQASTAESVGLGQSPKPITGRSSAVCPGGQYCTPYRSLGTYRPEETMSSTRSVHTKIAVRPNTVETARRGPVQSTSWGSGTGYCPNTNSICGVGWSHKDHSDVFHTTYNDTLNTSHGSPRIPHMASISSNSTVMSMRDFRKRGDH